MKPVLERNIQGGEQKLFRFENGFGASVVRHSFSYGYSRGLWELAVIRWGEDDEWELTYDTTITNDVVGSLNEEEVEEYLIQIQQLNKD